MTEMVTPSNVASGKAAHRAYNGPEDAFDGHCWLCGEPGRFVRDRIALSNSYSCASCNSPLRYQGQARAIVRAFAQRGSHSIAELVTEPDFRALKVYEPAAAHNLRRYFRELKGYVRSSYDPTAAPGEVRNGVRSEDLMNLSFKAESLDLVVTSDVFEHVRHPYRGFAEVFRVLRPGGMHIFTIPVLWPMRERTHVRVDVSGPEDVFLAPPVYHDSETNLVYNDFGDDLLDGLAEVGFVTDPMLFASTSATTSKHVTFCCTRPHAQRSVFRR